jgi:predicted ferric reductase
VLTLLIALTLFVTLPYHIWKKTHEWMGLSLLLGAAHATTIASDISRYYPLRLYILSWCVIAGISFMYRKFFYRFFSIVKKYKISSINRTNDTVEITMQPEEQKMNFSPGQFAYLSINGDESHPYSIVSAKNSSQLSFAIRIVGDGTLKLRDIQIGAPVSVEGPYGRFAERFIDSSRDAICIAGGIGITPFASMISSLETTNASNRKIALIHSVKNEHDVIYQQKFEQLQQKFPTFLYTLHLSSKDGRIKKDTLETLVNGMKKPIIYLCGPTKMMEGMRDSFLKIGIPMRNIVSEDFSLL